MSQNRNPFRSTLEGLKAGHLSADQVLPLAQRNLSDALPLLHALLKEIRDPCPPDVGGWPWHLLEVFWGLEGSSVCIETRFPPVGQLLVTHFFDQKILRNPGLFSDDDLLLLFEYCDENPHGGPLREKVVKAQSERLIPISKALRENPKQFADDIAEVKKRVSAYNFPPDLNALLDKVEEQICAAGDPFDHAATLKHLRTFYEKLHEQAGYELRTAKPETVDGTDLTKCGQALDFLKRKDVLTETMFELGKALYGVLSNQGVHAIKSSREYVRLCRNMVAEYALVLFFELEQRLT